MKAVKIIKLTNMVAIEFKNKISIENDLQIISNKPIKCKFEKNSVLNIKYSQ